MYGLQLALAELGGISSCEPVRYIVGIPSVIHHYKQHGLSLERRKLIAVLFPTFDGSGQVAPVFHACKVRSPGFQASGTPHWPFYYAIDNCLLQRIIRNCPGEDLPAFAESRRGGKVQLRSNRRSCMLPADDSVPLAAFVVSVVRFVVDNEQKASAFGDSLREIRLLLFLCLRPRAT